MTKLRAVLRRRWPLLLATTLVGVLVGLVSAQFARSDTVEQVFTATQTIVANAGSGASPLIPQDELKITRGAIPERAAVMFNETNGAQETAGDLAGTIATAFDADSNSLSISSNDVNPDLAAARVAAFTAAFLEVTNNQLQSESRRQLDQLKADLDAVTARLAAFDAANPQVARPEALGSEDIGIQFLLAERQSLVAQVEQAEQQFRDQERQISRTAPYESLGPEQPRPAASGLVSVPTSAPVRAALVGLLGLLLGGVVAMLIERVNRRIDTREELVEFTDIPILAEVGFLPEAKRRPNDDGSLRLEGVWSEPYRRVRSAIHFVQSTHRIGEGQQQAGAGATEPRVFLVTSTSPGEGKSTTVALTGEALAETGVPTLVVGGDFRRPAVDRMLGVPREPSMQDMARLDVNRAGVDDVVHQRGDSSLYVAPAGKGTREVSGLIEAAKVVATAGRERGATVLFDSAPLQAANDTLDLLPVVDYVILVVRSGRSTEAAMSDVIDTLTRMDAKILGIVLIGTTSVGRRQSYYYDYYSPSAEPPTLGPPAGPPAESPPAAPIRPAQGEPAPQPQPVAARSESPAQPSAPPASHLSPPPAGTPADHLPPLSPSMPPPAPMPPSSPNWTPPPQPQS